MYVYVYIYIYIYIYIHTYSIHIGRRRSSAGGRGSPKVGARYYTPDLTKLKVRWRMPLEIHCTSDNPSEHAIAIFCPYKASSPGPAASPGVAEAEVRFS